MKMFSPAGMANKGFFGGAGSRNGGDDGAGGRGGQGGVQTFGNPAGARSGGGAYPAGGANINGPDQGGGGSGGGSNFQGVFLLGAADVSGPLVIGYADGLFNDDPTFAGGTATPGSLSGFAIGTLRQQAASSTYFGMYGDHNQTDFYSIGWIDDNSTPQVWLASGVFAFTSVNQTSPPAPDGDGAAWQWFNAGGPPPAFTAGNSYSITVSSNFVPSAFVAHGGIVSTGPIQGAGYGGNGTGWYLGNLNGSFGCGTTTPDPAMWLDGGQIIIAGWGSVSPFSSSYYGIAFQGSLPQNAFNTVSLGPPANLVFATAAANGYSTTDFPGFTYWTWVDTHIFSFIGASLTVTLS